MLDVVVVVIAFIAFCFFLRCACAPLVHNVDDDDNNDASAKPPSPPTPLPPNQQRASRTHNHETTIRAVGRVAILPSHFVSHHHHHRQHHHHKTAKAMCTCVCIYASYSLCDGVCQVSHRITTTIAKRSSSERAVWPCFYPSRIVYGLYMYVLYFMSKYIHIYSKRTCACVCVCVV